MVSTTDIPVPSARTPPRRGFALPLVIAVIVIASILITAVLTRHSGQAMLTQRHIDRYAEHHAFKGLEEAVTAWINGNSGGSIRDALDVDGHAFDIELPDGQKLVVYFEDAQGTVLGRFSGLADNDLDDAAATVEGLRRTAHERAPAYLRKEGPLAVSLVSAEREVLQAVSLAVLSPTAADALVGELLSLQVSDDLSSETLRTAFEAAGVSTEDQGRLARLLTTEPSLYRVWVDLMAPQGSEPLVTYKGLCLGGSARGAARTGTSITRNSAFLSWERVVTEQELASTPRRINQ